MTRSMTRWTVAGCITLAALGAVAVLGVVSVTAEAAPSVSPFAGTYDWFSGTDSWAVTISDGGQITGSLVRSSSYTTGSFSGRVGADGSYSFTVSVTFPTMDGGERRQPGPAYRTSHYKTAGSMDSDADGNIVGTADTGESFFWLRR